MRLRIALPIIIACLVSLPYSQARADKGIVIVANLSGEQVTLTRQEVRNLFMGGALPYQLQAVSLPPQHQLRVLFNTKVIGLTESRIQSYWAQMRFSGRKKAPLELDNQELLLEYLTQREGAVGYISSSEPIPTGLTVIYRSK